MDRHIKAQIFSNLIFILCFALIFSVYCQITSSLLKSFTDRGGNAQVSAEASEHLIVLDAGHGGEDGGAVGVGGILEKELNLHTSIALGEYLRFAGFEVVQTRTEDVLLYDRNVDFKGKKKVLDLAARLKIAEEVLPDLFISIHMNSFPEGRYSGLTVYYSPNDPRSYDAAELIRSGVIRQLQADNNRELKRAGSNIYLLNRLDCPSVLVECGFLSNESECQKLSQPTYRHKLSLIIYGAVSSFFQE